MSNLTADRLLDLVRADPHQAEALATDALHHARAADDLHAEAESLRVLGMAARQDHRYTQARSLLEDAVVAADLAGHPRTAALCRMTLALTVAFQGDPRHALTLINQAISGLDGVEAARALFQRAVIHQTTGDHQAALDGYTRAAQLLQASEDWLTLAQLYNNRGLLHHDRRRHHRALLDFRRAETLYRNLGMDRALADVLTHLAATSIAVDDQHTALACYQEADQILERLDVVDPVGLTDRVGVLVGAGLTEQACATAKRAVALLARGGDSVYLAKGIVAHAEAEFAAGRRTLAAELADAAAIRLARLGNHRATVDARGLAATACGRHDANLAAEAAQLGLRQRALDLRLAAGAYADVTRTRRTAGELVVAAQQGDRVALAELIDEFASTVWQMATVDFRLPRSDAADVCQMVWVLLVRRLETVREPEAIAGWLQTAARYECLRVLRAARNAPWPVEELPREKPAIDEGLDAEVVAAVEGRVAWEALDSLKPGERELMRLLFSAEEPSYDEIAERLGIPRGSIGPTRGRILAKLRKHPAVAALASDHTGEEGS